MTSRSETINEDDFVDKDIINVNLKFSVERNILLKALSRVQSVIQKRNSVEILSNVKFEVQGNIAKLTGTDMGITVIEDIPVNVKQGIKFTVYALTLFEIVKKLPENINMDFHIESLESGRLTIITKHAEFTLPITTIDEFPMMAKSTMTSSFVIMSYEIVDLVNKTKFSVAKEETRFFLTGLYLHKVEENGNKFLACTSTDGHRLARNMVDLPDDANDFLGVILPSKTINELPQILEGWEGEVKISLSQAKICFEFANVTIISKLIDGRYPDYTKVIPKNNIYTMEVNRKSFIDAIERMAILSSEKSYNLRLEIFSTRLIVSVLNDIKVGTEEVSVKYNGPTIDAGFNIRYLLEMCNVLEGNEIKFHFENGALPSLVKDDALPNALFVLMPIQV